MIVPHGNWGDIPIAAEPLRLLFSSTPPTPADMELLWRESCWEVLGACLNGASPKVIAMLADAMFVQRQIARAHGIHLGSVSRMVITA